jgi:hypothetical protein
MPPTLSQPVATLTMTLGPPAARWPRGAGLALAALVSIAGWSLIVLAARLVL